MKTLLVLLAAVCLSPPGLAARCLGAPAPKPRPPKERFTIKAHKGMIYAIAFSPNGKILASAGRDKIIKLWDVATGKNLATLSGHTDSVIGLAFSPDGKLLASTSDDLSIRLWSIPGNKGLTALATRWGSTNYLIFSPDGKTLVTGPPSHCVLWDVPTGKIRKKIETPGPDHPQSTPTSLVYDPSRRLLCAVWTKDSRVKVWDVVGGKALRRLTCPEGDYLFHGVAFSPDCKRLVAAWNGVCVWDIATGKVIGNYGCPKDIYAPAFSPDGKLLAAGWKVHRGPPEGIVSILDPLNGKELATLRGHPHAIECLAFSPDGKTLAVASAHQIIKLWDVSGVRTPDK